VAYGLKDRILEVFDLGIAEDSRNTRLQFGAFKYGSPFYQNIYYRKEAFPSLLLS
jgi:hypothetical protein